MFAGIDEPGAATGWHFAADAGGWIRDMFYLPGNFLLENLLQLFPALVSHPKLGPDFVEAGGHIAALFSGTFWFTMSITILLSWRIVDDVCEAATNRARTIRFHIRSGMQRIRIMVLSRRGRPGTKPDKRSSLSVDDVDLDALDIAILKAGRSAAARISLGAEEPAGKRHGTRNIREALERLEQLHLIQSVISADDGQHVYRTTRFGNYYLVACGHG